MTFLGKIWESHSHVDFARGHMKISVTSMLGTDFDSTPDEQNGVWSQNRPFEYYDFVKVVPKVNAKTDQGKVFLKVSMNLGCPTFLK